MVALVAAATAAMAEATQAVARTAAVKAAVHMAVAAMVGSWAEPTVVLMAMGVAAAEARTALVTAADGAAA